MNNGEKSTVSQSRASFGFRKFQTYCERGGIHIGRIDLPPSCPRLRVGSGPGAAGVQDYGGPCRNVQEY